MNKILKLTNIISLVFLILVSVSCKYEKACTDPEAKNWDLNADKNCCCEYPGVTLNINHSGINTEFITEFNQRYFVLESQFLFSNFKFVDNSHKANSVDTIYSFQTTLGEVDYIDDFTYFTNKISSAKIGVFKNRGEAYNAIRFNIGISENQSKIISLDLPKNHPLSDAFNLEKGKYLSTRLLIARDSISGDSLEYDFYSPISNIEFDFTSNDIFTAVKGSDLFFELTIDYSKLFDNIDFETDISEQKDILINNYPLAFTFNGFH